MTTDEMVGVSLAKVETGAISEADDALDAIIGRDMDVGRARVEFGSCLQANGEGRYRGRGRSMGQAEGHKGGLAKHHSGEEDDARQEKRGGGENV